MPLSRPPGPLNVLFLHRTPVEGLPPVQNQISILVERGHAVTVFQEHSMESRVGAELLPSTVSRSYASEETHRITGRLMKIPRFLRFRRKIRSQVERLLPNVVIVGDPEAAFAVGDLPQRLGCLLVWDFHELPERQGSSGTQWWANNFVWRHGNLPQIIVFPDVGRAEIFARDAGLLASSIIVIPNCPRLIRTLPKPMLRKKLAEHLPNNVPIVLYHGAIGTSHGLEAAIRSIPKWPSEAVLVAKGPVANHYAMKLKGLAKAARVEDRLLIFDPGWQSNADHFAFIAGADIGWTALEPTRPCWHHAAFASNKRFECMALAIPQVTDNNPRVPELVEATGCGLCIEPNSSEAAATAVGRLLESPELRSDMGNAARSLHLKKYHYEQQFEPLLILLESLSNARVDSRTIQISRLGVDNPFTV